MTYRSWDLQYNTRRTEKLAVALGLPRSQLGPFH